LATCLAVVAAFAFVLDGALGADHHPPTPASGCIHYHSYAYSHAPAAAADHQVIDGDAAGVVDLAAAHQDSAPESGPDAGANCCCACSAAIVLPSLTAQAVPFVLLRSMATANRRHDDGIVTEGLRRPPRPLAIA
jgi:hypothetical protein